MSAAPEYEAALITLESTATETTDTRSPLLHQSTLNEHQPLLPGASVVRTGKQHKKRHHHHNSIASKTLQQTEDDFAKLLTDVPNRKLSLPAACDNSSASEVPADNRCRSSSVSSSHFRRTFLEVVSSPTLIHQQPTRSLSNNNIRSSTSSTPQLSMNEAADEKVNGIIHTERRSVPETKAECRVETTRNWGLPSLSINRESSPKINSQQDKVKGCVSINGNRPNTIIQDQCPDDSPKQMAQSQSGTAGPRPLSLGRDEDHVPTSLLGTSIPTQFQVHNPSIAPSLLAMSVVSSDITLPSTVTHVPGFHRSICVENVQQPQCASSIPSSSTQPISIDSPTVVPSDNQVRPIHPSTIPQSSELHQPTETSSVNHSGESVTPSTTVPVYNHQSLSSILPSPFSNQAVARMQHLSNRTKGKQRVGARISGRDLVSGTWGQISALGLRRTSSVCSEPSLNTGRKHRYEFLLMQHSKNKLARMLVGESQRKNVQTTLGSQQIPTMAKSVIAPDKTSGSNSNQDLLDDNRNPSLETQSKQSSQPNQQTTEIRSLLNPSGRTPIRDLQLRLTTTMKSSPALNSASTKLESSVSTMVSNKTNPPQQRSMHRSVSCGPGAIAGSEKNATPVLRKNYSISPITLYLFQCDCLLNALLTHVTPSLKEKESKRQTFNALSQCLNAWHGSQIRLHLSGSTAYDVDATSSDLDIVITTKEADHLKVLQGLRDEIEMMKRRCSIDPSMKWPLE